MRASGRVDIAYWLVATSVNWGEDSGGGWTTHQLGPTAHLYPYIYIRADNLSDTWFKYQTPTYCRWTDVYKKGVGCMASFPSFVA